MAYTEELITAPRGVKLYARRREAASPKAEIIVVHGFGEHSGRYSELSEYLVYRGFTVTAYDHRGHGHSTGLAGHVDKFSDYEDDLALVIATIRSRSDQKVFLIAHSMGGLITLRYLAGGRTMAAGAVISAPLLGFAVRVPAHKAIIGRVSARLSPKFRMRNEIDPMVLSRDTEICKAYASDPLVNRLVSARWFVEAMQGMTQASEGANRIKTPLLVMHGTEDKLASLNATKQVFERIGSADKELVIHQGFYHELFNEPEKKDLYQVAASWIESRNSQQSGGGHVTKNAEIAI